MSGQRVGCRRRRACAAAVMLVLAATGTPAVRAQERDLATELSPDAVRDSARRGNAAAQYLLGWLLLNAAGPVDQAIAWYEQAANQGYGKAQFALAELYHGGTRVAENYELAVRWYRLAARQDMPEAQLALGRLHRDGKAIAKDLVQAAYWLTLAARQGNAEAQSHVGELYAAGLGGFAQDRVEAYKWFVVAAAAGYTPAITLRDDLRDRMTHEQIAEAQRRAATLAGSLPARSPLLVRQDQDLADLIAKLRAAAAPPAAKGAAAATY